MSEEQNANFGLPETSEQTIARLTKENVALRATIEADAGDPTEGTGPVDSQGFPKEYVYLTVFPGRDKHDLAYVPLGIKGYVIKVTRGIEVIVPKVFVTECLEHAVEDITVQSEGGLITRPSLRYPYSVRGPATEDAWKAFQAKMRSDSKGVAVAA